MVNVANIVCKTAGVAGLSAAVYDAYANAKHHSSAQTTSLSADTFESIIAAERSNTNASHVTNAIQKKVGNFRMQNPLVPLIGKVKGFAEGFISSLGDNIMPIALSSIAIGTKGFMQKTGAWGLGIYAVYQLAKEGFGVGKTTPVDE